MGKEALKHLRNCYLLEQNANVDDWVKTIKFIFEKNKKFNQLTNNGYKELIEKYPYEDYFSQWEEIINQS